MLAVDGDVWLGGLGAVWMVMVMCGWGGLGAVWMVMVDAAHIREQHLFHRA